MLCFKLEITWLFSLGKTQLCQSLSLIFLAANFDSIWKKMPIDWRGISEKIHFAKLYFIFTVHFNVLTAGWKPGVLNPLV